MPLCAVDKTRAGLFLFDGYYKEMAATWQLEDPKVVDGVKTAKLITGSIVARETGDEGMLDVDLDLNVEGPQQFTITCYRGKSLLFGFCHCADMWALEYLQSHSLRLFQKSLDMTQVKAIYRPLIDLKYPRDPSILASIDMRTVPFWDFHSETTLRPSELDCDVTPAFEIRCMWFADTGNACGLTLEVVEVAYDSGC